MTSPQARTAIGVGLAAAGALVLFGLVSAKDDEPVKKRARPGHDRASERSASSEAPSGRPTTPPVRGRDAPFSLPDPEAPEDIDEAQEAAYAEAVRSSDPHPAEAALRKAVRYYVAHNRQLADAQAQEEGLTLEEVEELTYFGFVAQQSQRWPEVEEVLGRPLEPEIRAAAENLLDQTNEQFKSAMRKLVENGGLQAERGALIRRTQRAYREGYFQITGMNEALLQDLLAGDLARRYPPSQTPPPEVSAQPAELPETAAPRPEAAPEAPQSSSALEEAEEG